MPIVADKGPNSGSQDSWDTENFKIPNKKELKSLSKAGEASEKAEETNVKASEASVAKR